MSPTNRWIFGWCLALALPGSFGRVDAGFSVVDLGPAGANQAGYATGINASGWMSGYSSTAGGPNQAVAATPGGGFQAINTGGLTGITSSTANAINASNNVAGTYYDSLDRTYHAFTTANGRAVDLGTFGSGALKGVNTFGVGISATGEVVGTARLSNGIQEAFRSSGPGQLSAIGMPGGSLAGQAAGVNSTGTVVGSYLNLQGASRVFTAAGATGVDLLTQYAVRGFGTNTYGSAINDRGGVTGYGDFGGQYHSFYAATDPTTGVKSFTDIGVAGGFSSVVSVGMNNFGQVVGRMDNQGSNSRAFFWDPSVGVLDLNTLLDVADQGRWSLTVAAGINDLGQVVGQGYYNGQLHGFMLTPVPGSLSFFPRAGSVPAPPSLGLALGGLALAGGWRRLRRGRTAGRDAA